MRYLDFALQTVLMLGALGVLVVSAFYNDLISLIAVDQFFLGVWQVAGCVIYLAVDPANNDYRKTHVLISLSYVLSLLFLGGVLSDVSKVLFAVYFFVPSWSLAIFYYFITFKTAFPRNGRGKFLPHLSF